MSEDDLINRLKKPTFSEIEILLENRLEEESSFEVLGRHGWTTHEYIRALMEDSYSRDNGRR